MSQGSIDIGAEVLTFRVRLSVAKGLAARGTGRRGL